MKKLNRKYSFPVLSVVAICSFFIFTGGVLEENNTQDSPPIINFREATYNNNNHLVGSVQKIEIEMTGWDPYQHDVTESCDFPINNPPKTTQKYDSSSPESYTWLISPSGTDTTKLDYYYSYQTGNDKMGVHTYNFSQNTNKLLTVAYSFSTPGNWKLVCRARTVSRTPAKYKNGKLVSGGDTTYGAWTEQSYTVTIGGTAVLPQQKYTFKSLYIVPAAGDPTPGKTITFSDPARQYIEILSPTKASMKFYWTPDAADVAAYPNLASKYEFSYTNADYSIVKNAASGYWDTFLYFEGQQIRFRYYETGKRLGFYKSSKKVVGSNDWFFFALN